MMPDNSLPGLAGNGGIQENRPSQIRVSGRLTPMARERIATSPGPELEDVSLQSRPCDRRDRLVHCSDGQI